MKGNNTFELNQPTICEAVQFWLDAQLTEKVKVEKVESKASSGYGSGGTFAVTFAAVEEKP